MSGSRSGARAGRARGRAGAAFGTLGALLVIGALATGGVVLLLDRLSSDPQLEPVRCAADVDGTSWYLSPEQADNAALLAGMALDRDLPARAVTIAVATALQESRLENIDYGDRDSIGLFQQRPSQGWGTVEQIMDPVYSTGKFYDGLVEIDGYESMAVTEAAQAVQRSGFPDAYAQHEGRSRAWASGLTGHSPASVTCSLDPSTTAGDPEAVRERAERDLGDGARVTASEDGTWALLDATGVPGTRDDERATWAGAHWAVATAWALDVSRVDTAEATWVRGRGAHAWLPASEADDAGAAGAAGDSEALGRPGAGEVRIWLAP